MTATRAHLQISQPLIAVGAIMVEGTEDGSWGAVTQSLNAVYGQTRSPIMARYSSEVAIPAGTAWTEVVRADVHLQEDLGVLVWTVYGEGNATDTQVRAVLDPDGAATVLATITLPSTLGTFTGGFSLATGDSTIAIQVRDTGAVGGRLIGYYLAPDLV